MRPRGCCGCFFVLLCLLAAGVALIITKAPHLRTRVQEWVKNTFEDVTRQADFERAWQPPSASPNAAWFPAQIGAWRAVSSTPVAGLPELHLATPGWHAEYRRGGRKLQINVLPATELEKDGIYARMKNALRTGGFFRLFESSNKLSAKVSGGQQTEFWWLKGWLFIFRTADAEAADFPEQYLTMIGSQDLERR